MPSSARPSSSHAASSNNVDNSLDDQDRKYLSRRDRPPPIVAKNLPKEDKNAIAKIIHLSPKDIHALEKGPWDVFKDTLKYDPPQFIMVNLTDRDLLRVLYARVNTSVTSWRCLLRLKILFRTPEGLAYAKGCDFCEAHEQICLYVEGSQSCDVCIKKNKACTAGGRPSTKHHKDYVEYLDKRVGLGRNPEGTAWEAPFASTFIEDFLRQGGKFVYKGEEDKLKKQVERTGGAEFYIDKLPKIPDVPRHPGAEVIEAIRAHREALKEEIVLCNAREATALSYWQSDHNDQHYDQVRGATETASGSDAVVDDSAAQAEVEALMRRAREEQEALAAEAERLRGVRQDESRREQREQFERDGGRLDVERPPRVLKGTQGEKRKRTKKK